MVNMSKVEAVSKFLIERFPKGIQMFDCRGIDPVDTIYCKNGVEIMWSWYYEYIEVYGLTDAEYKELEGALRKSGWKE